MFFFVRIKKKVPRKRRTVPRKRRFLQATGPDHPEEYFGDKEPARNPQRQRKHIFLDAGCLSLCPCTKSGRAICYQHSETDHLLNDGDITFDTQWTILNYREVYWYSWMWHLWSQYLILICDRKCWTRRLSPGASKLNAWRCRLLHLIDWLFVAFKLKWYIARSIKT